MFNVASVLMLFITRSLRVFRHWKHWNKQSSTASQEEMAGNASYYTYLSGEMLEVDFVLHDAHNDKPRVLQDFVTTTPDNVNWKHHLKSMSSTSKMRVEFGGMTGGKPRGPYP